MSRPPHNSTPSAPNDDGLLEEQDDAIIGTAFRWSLLVILLIAAIAGGIIFWNQRPDEIATVEPTDLAEVKPRELPAAIVPEVNFRDVTQEAGITFSHQNGARGNKLLPETMGGGGGFFDFDGDGDQDILLINSNYWPDDPRENLPPVTMALYANDGAGHYSDVTVGSGFDIALYGMGAAFGDYDNDGLVDVFISTVGENKLFHNDGQGKFSDVTSTAGVAGDTTQWSSSSGWFDYDNDGDLDLFVCNYLDWSPEYDLAQNFQLTGGGRAYGRPQNFEGTYPYLYRNDGNGTFTDVSAESGVQIKNPATGVPLAKSLAVTFADFDHDGWIDATVANDTVQNFMLRNRGDGTFEEIGALVGVAFDKDGKARGAMGNDVARFRNNDAIGIAIGNFANEMTALYVANQRKMQFVDEAIATGLGPNTRLELTFGLFFFDYDLDGRLDLLAANGHLEEDINRVQPSQHYEQPPQLFWNGGAGLKTEFLPVDEKCCGKDFLQPVVGRGAAYADIDADGDLDVLIIACGKPARLLRNDQSLNHHWLRFQLRGDNCNRDAIGAWVEITQGRSVQARQVMPTRSYQSQVELPVTFGLGQNPAVDSVRVIWPDGTEKLVDNWKLNQVNLVDQSASSP